VKLLTRAGGAALATAILGTMTPLLADGMSAVHLPGLEEKLVAVGAQSAQVHIRTIHDWNDFWRSLGSKPLPPDLLQHDLLIYMIGIQGSGGYSVTIDQVQYVSDRTRVHVLRCEPPQGSSQVTVETAPYAATLIRKLNTPVEWVVRNGKTGVRPCR
jgi:hypothetical protein